MADKGLNKTISKLNTGFPDYLDFDKLRTSAIRYLGELSGKIWTDHNEHDPGITILESLIYAIMDLGYRTSLPAGDLFTRDPEDNTPDNNFFPVPRILGNNPLTITDYRKLLVDIEGVKNAWLEPDDQTSPDFCKDAKQTRTVRARSADRAEVYDLKDPCECSNLNGLYHVYIQLDEGIEQNKHLREKTLLKIKDSLVAHRNLCEDFIDIKVLCRLELGICAEIDLETSANAGDVYVKMVEALQEFLSPSPKFYSLRQMLDKNKTIDEIFAGRPFNLSGSHGFVDTEEFEQLKLKKELHLSDVYHLLSEIKGIRRVRNVGWIKCCTDKKSITDWQLALPENHIPEFSSKCSGFIFTRNGLPEKPELKKFESLFEMKKSGLQKAWYDEPSSFLDPVMPQGVYRNDLGDYYSVQNDFPRVYGIKEGGLSDSESDKRKAQALQLQGFLLFFDQLLANYLSQLKNMRSLFSLTSQRNGGGNHTYFINQLKDAPQIDKLLRFSEDEKGSTGRIMAYPVSRKKLEEMITGNKLEEICSDNEIIPPHSFCFSEERDVAVNQLKDDFLYGEYEPVFASTADGCWFFYFITTSNDIAIISKQFFKDEKKAAIAAASVKYSATFNENYRSFMTSDQSGEFFSFDIELTLDIYSKYLQLIVEDKDLYLSRRQDFLNHLLSRFAETFTDFAILTSPFARNNEMRELMIKSEERFLSRYDDLSSNRGKAYDYLKNKWKTPNVSGFEKRVKALSGMENWDRHSLCNFVVEPADKLYRITIELFDMAFTVDKTFNETSALLSLKSVFNKLLNPVFEYEYRDYKEEFQIFIKDDSGNKYNLERAFKSEDQALSFVKVLDDTFRFQPELKNDVFVSRSIHKILFTGAEGNIISESRQHFTDKAEADRHARKLAGKLSALLRHEEEFITSGDSAENLKLIPVSINDYPFIFIDEEQFEFRQFEVFHLNEKRKRFSVQNDKISFQFDSINDYPDARSARAMYKTIISLLPVESSYKIIKNKDTEEYELFLIYENKRVARYYESFPGKDAARTKLNDLLAEISTYTYRLSVTPPIPDEWEFKYRSGDTSGNLIEYISRGKFKDYDSASQAAGNMYANLKDLKITSSEKEILLNLKKGNTKLEMAARIDNPTDEDQKKALAVLSSSKKLAQLISVPSDRRLMSVLEKSRINPGEDFIYKLVDKDNLHAYHPVFTKKEAEAGTFKDNLLSAAIAGYSYIDIATGGDITRKRKDPVKNSVTYHFLIKCNNRIYTQGRLKGKDLVLFESTTAYSSQEGATLAFKEQYLLILKYARDFQNYGPGKKISMVEELKDPKDDCNNKGAIVFIPRETQLEFGDYEVQKIIAPLAASYPVRFIRKNKYAYVLGNPDTVSNTFVPDWKSCNYFRSPEEAMSRFRFFLILLKYPGNFYTENDHAQCDYRLFIREVLAVSAHGFPSAEKAWGEEGVERFICISQSEGGFHNYLNNRNCSTAFYVACNRTGLRHPCTYDTPSRRDEVLKQLYRASDFNFMDLIESVDESRIVLKDISKKPLAVLHTNIIKDINLSQCEWLLRLVESAYDDKNYIKKEGKFFLIYRYSVDDKNERYYELAEPASQIGFNDWKRELRRIACYFPIRRITNACDPGGKGQFSVQIKFPGFDPCDKNFSYPCKPLPIEEKCRPSCDFAWISDCCFDECCQALDFYLSSLLLLRRFENYRAVFGCDCGPYGIELHPQLTIRGKSEFLKRSSDHSSENIICFGDWNPENRSLRRKLDSFRKKNFCFSEIVAINPQSYTSAEMVCDAVSRSKKLINSEGLHLVEHILLRPRCKNADGYYEECDCEALPRPCIDSKQICHFKWIAGGDIDPCESEKTVCLTPGCDPYSFIATVVMPAWPERFRSESGRKVMEKLMQREAPAHVLLRILWLNPRDFCCAEFYYKLWIKWMAHKLCEPEYSNCNFLKLLFRKEFQPLSVCSECIPCICDDGKPESCSPETEDPCSGRNVFSNINELFCWSSEREYNFRYCEASGEKR